jgi:peptidoglycan/LPS O-acetylase OafA/YrhL
MNGNCLTSSMLDDRTGFREERRIRGFDGLRAIAFLLVFCSHKIRFAHADSFGDVGVSLFFVLSGFLITRILARSRAEIESGQATVPNNLGRFYLRRTVRIFPPYYLILAFFTAASLFVPIEHFTRSEKVAYLLYGTNLLVASRGYWVGDFGHFWSLAVEEQFYVAFAPLVLFVSRKHTMLVCFAVILLGLATKIILEARHASAMSIDLNSFVNFVPLGIGGVIGLRASCPAPKWFSGGTAQVVVISLYLILPAAFGTWLEIWSLLGKLSAVAAGVLLFQIFNGQQSWFVAILERPPFRGIGRISYGAYLVHLFVHFDVIESLLPHLGDKIAVPRFAQVLAELAVSLIVAGISWRYFERPIIAWAKRVTSRRSSASASAVAPSGTASSGPWGQ